MSDDLKRFEDDVRQVVEEIKALVPEESRRRVEYLSALSMSVGKIQMAVEVRDEMK